MPSAFSLGSRIRTNIAAENALNSIESASRDIAQSQLRLSTGRRINSAADDVSGYITSRALSARNSSLKSALTNTGEAINVTSIVQDSFDNINSLLSTIKEAAAQGSSGSLGTDEKVSLAKGAYRLSQQIQLVVDSTVYGGRALIKGSFSGDWVVGFDAQNTTLEVALDLTTSNADLNVASRNFDLNSVSGSPSGSVVNFGGVTNLNLSDLNSVSEDNLGIFSDENIGLTITSISQAQQNIRNAAAYVGGIQVRLQSQEGALSSQITNYSSAISRIDDADVAQEQLNLSKSFFLEASGITVLSQANQNPFSFLGLLSS